MAERIKPADLPEGSMVQVTVEDGGVFTAYYFPDQFQRVYLGSGDGNTIDEAVREALDEAGV